MKNPLLKVALHFHYPEAVGNEWNPAAKNDMTSEFGNQFGGWYEGATDKVKAFASNVIRLRRGSKSATGEMPRSDVTPDNYPIHFAIANALGGKVESFKRSPYIGMPDGDRLFLCIEGTGMATVWNEKTTSESSPFYYDDENAAIIAAASVLPKKPSRRRTKFDQADKIRLHGLGVKASLRSAWDKAMRVGMLKFESNRYSFTRKASAGVRSGLKDTLVKVNSLLSRCHIPKSPTAHEAAVKTIACRIHNEGHKLDKMSGMAKRAAKATHVLYDAGPSGYTVRIMNGGNTIDEYNAGNSLYDSVSQLDRTDSDTVKHDQLLQYAVQTAKEMAGEFGVPENKVYRDEDLLAEEREEAWGLNDADEEFLNGIGSTQDEPSAEHGTSLRDALAEHDRLERAPSKFDAKFLRDLHIGGSKKAAFSPEDAKQFREENDGSSILLNEDKANNGVVPSKEGDPADGSDMSEWGKALGSKTASTYKVEKRGNGWYIVGLPQETFNREGMVTKPDSFIIPGLNHGLGTPEGLAQGIYEQLYDEFQTNNHLKEGDIFDTPVGQFICEGFHVLPHDDKAKDVLQRVPRNPEL